MAKYRAEEEENLTEQEDAAPAGAYPAVMEITRRLEVELGMSGTAIEVVDAACKELNISTEGLSLVERAHRAHDQLYGAPSQAAADKLDIEVSIVGGGGGGESGATPVAELGGGWELYMFNGAAQHKNELRLGQNAGGLGSLAPLPTSGAHKMGEAEFDARGFRQVLAVGSDGTWALVERKDGSAIRAADAFKVGAAEGYRIKLSDGLEADSPGKDPWNARGNHGPFFIDLDGRGGNWMWCDAEFDPRRPRMGKICGTSGACFADESGGFTWAWYGRPQAAPPRLLKLESVDSVEGVERIDTLKSAIDGMGRLQLVPKGSPLALKLDHASALREGREAPLTAAGQHVGLFWESPRNAWGNWDYIDLGVSDEVRPLTVKLEGPYIVWRGPHGEMVFDISMWQLEAGNHLVAVKACPGDPGGPTRKSDGAAGRDFVFNGDSTVSPRNAPHLCLGHAGAPCPNALVLVRGDSKNKCIFDKAALRSGKPTPLTLVSHPGLAIAKRYTDERHAGEWRYIESGVAKAPYAISAVLTSDGFIELPGEDLVLDIAFWKFDEGNTVNFVGGSSAGRTKIQDGPAGRSWVLNEDGSVSTRSQSDLFLGVADKGGYRHPSMEESSGGGSDTVGDSGGGSEQWWHLERDSDFCGGDASSDACSSLEQARELMRGKPHHLPDGRAMAYQYYAPAGRLYNKPIGHGGGSQWRSGSMNLFMYGRAVGHTCNGKTLIALDGVDVTRGDGKIEHNVTSYEQALEIAKRWADTNAAAFWHSPSNRMILKPKNNGARWTGKGIGGEGIGTLFMWADKPLFPGEECGGDGAPIDGTYDGPDGLRYIVHARGPTSVIAEVYHLGRSINISYEMRRTSNSTWQGQLPKRVHGGARITWAFEHGGVAFNSTAHGKPARRFVKQSGSGESESKPAAIEGTSSLPAAVELPRLILVSAGSSDALVFDHAATLRAGKSAPLTSSGVHVGPYWPAPRNAWGHWDYIDLGVGEVQPLKVKLEGPYIVWPSPHGEMVFDVSMWRLHEGNHLVAVKACPGNPGGPTRMSKDAAGRDFVLNTDGTISMRTAPQLRLGVAPADGSSPDFPGKIVAQQMQGCWMCFCWPGGWALFSKTAQGPDHIVHSGMVCLMFTIPLPFTEPRKRVPYTNGFNKADGSEPHNIDTYVSPGCVKNGPSCSCRICPG